LELDRAVALRAVEMQRYVRVTREFVYATGLEATQDDGLARGAGDHRIEMATRIRVTDWTRHARTVALAVWISLIRVFLADPTVRADVGHLNRVAIATLWPQFR
jgi:hypothetical protein